MVIRKHLDRPYWSRILEKRFAYKYVCNPDFDGCISIIYMDKVSTPLIRTMYSHNYVIANEGFYWVQFLPRNANYTFTATFNSNHDIVQWYFDITLKNGVTPTDNELPYFDDLFLDIIVLPGKEPLLVDEDELEDALSKNIITKEEYNLAYIQAHMLLRTLASDENKLRDLSCKYASELLNKIGIHIIY